MEEVFGIEPALLNDDRPARALDAIAPHLEQFAGTVGARAIAEFGIDVSRLHWDVTSMSVHGAYTEEDQDPDQREVYRVLEDIHTLSDPRKRDPVLTLRRILVHSSGHAASQEAARAKRLAKAAEADPAQVLIQYQGQGAVERRYADFKGPLAVTPVFVQHNCRAAALIQVIRLALLVFCLIERQVRRALGPEQTMAGLYPDNRRVKPTGRMILYHLGELNLRIGNVTDPPTVQITHGVQLHLLELLGIEVTQTRSHRPASATCELRA